MTLRSLSIYIGEICMYEENSVRMVQKETNFGKMEKGRGGKLLLFATQALCAFFLLHLLYIELITFKSTSSQQAKSKFN